MQQEQTTRLQLLMNNVTCNEATSVTVNMFEVLAIVVAVIVIFAIVVSAIVVTSTGTHSNFSHSDCTHSGFNLNSLRLPMAVTTVVFVVILPSYSFFISRLKFHRLQSRSVYSHSHSSCTHTGYSLSHSGHSGLHAVAGRVEMAQSLFCHYKLWSQPIYSQRVQQLRLQNQQSQPQPSVHDVVTTVVVIAKTMVPIAAAVATKTSTATMSKITAAVVSVCLHVQPQSSWPQSQLFNGWLHGP